MPDLNGFDASQVAPSGSYDPLPAGKYEVIITDSVMRANRAGTGSYLALTFEILEGEYKGRLAWARLNLDHPKADVVKFARAELSAICRAVGVLQPRDSEALHSLPLVIRVVCKKRDDTGDIVNEIKGYSARTAATDRVVAPVASGDVPPWNRR